MQSNTQEKITFCRICEPYCGMIATIQNDKIVSIRPDPDHPTSKGYACPKGMAYPEIQNDPDRVLYPLKKQPDGRFTRVSWEYAMADILSRLKSIKQHYGGESIGLYYGNPSLLNYSNGMWAQFFMQSVGSSHAFSAGSQDNNSRFAASALLYGSPVLVPIPDIANTELLVILGANPVISHGSLFSMPRIKDHLHAITKRGGQVLVIDPRRNETAREFDWLPIIPDSDAWLLLSLLQVMATEELLDIQSINKQATGFEGLAELSKCFTPEYTENFTGITADQVRSLARQLVVKKASIYGRTGTCLGSSSTLVNFLIDVVNLAAGNLDKRGGALFGESPFPLFDKMIKLSGALSYGKSHSRIGGFRDMIGSEPAANMAAEITTSGKGQMKALFVTAGNPVLSTPNGPALEEALGQLELMVVLDLYVSETSAYADYILPGTAMYEREDAPFFSGTFFAKPFIQVTDAVVPPAGEARPEWKFFDELIRGIIGPLGKLPVAITPKRLLDSIIRTGRDGDKFGLRPNGLSFSRLLKHHPHGYIFAEQQPVGRLSKVVHHKDKKVHLEYPEIYKEIDRLSTRKTDPAYPLRLIGMREIRSENSWMHNSPSLRVARTPHAARMHPEDAAKLGLIHHGLVRLVSKSGSIELTVLVTEDIKSGVVAVPHGWGHKGKGRWQRANKEGGVNINVLASSDPQDLEMLVGSSHLSGIHIRAERVFEATKQINDTGVYA